VTEERKKEEQYYNNYYNSGKGYFNKTFSFPDTPEMHQLFEDFKELSRRDGWSLSQTYVKALVEFLARHPLPNPQAKIDRMLEIRMPLKPTTMCCVPSCRRKTRWILRLQNSQRKCQEFQVCDGHKRWLHPDFRLLVSYREMT
jgi:anaerobic selenocysteine-containing dehydrogenase